MLHIPFLIKFRGGAGSQQWFVTAVIERIGDAWCLVSDDLVLRAANFFFFLRWRTDATQEETLLVEDRR
jgi:hypothetical protein